MPMLADTADAVIGVDTHTDTHTACLVDRLGRQLAVITIPADPGGCLKRRRESGRPCGSRRLHERCFFGFFRSLEFDGGRGRDRRAAVGSKT